MRISGIIRIIVIESTWNCLFQVKNTTVQFHNLSEADISIYDLHISSFRTSFHIVFGATAISTCEKPVFFEAWSQRYIERERETVEEAGQIPLLLRYRTPENKEPTRLTCIWSIHIGSSILLEMRLVKNQWSFPLLLFRFPLCSLPLALWVQTASWILLGN